MVIRTCECCCYSTSSKCSYEYHMNSKRHLEQYERCLVSMTSLPEKTPITMISYISMILSHFYLGK